MTFRAFLVIGLGLFLAVNVESAGSNGYVVTDLGTLGGTTTIANYINNRGEIVGTSRLPSGLQHAFLYRNGFMVDLGTLGGTESFGNIVNDRGEVAGASNMSDSTRHAFLFDGVMHDLGVLPGSTFSTAFALNNRGQVFGGSQLPGKPVFHAVLFDRNHVQDLGTLGGPSSFATRINEVGDVTGRADLATGFSRAFLYRQGVMRDVGVLPGDVSARGNDLNNLGELVGQSCNDGATLCRGFLWWNGEMMELGSLGGTQTNPLSINYHGEVVGASRTAISGAGTHAFLWARGVMMDLNDYIEAGSGWELQQATCINAAGQIVGNGRLNGQPRAFLLTPAIR